eukprot:TRINITY_DN13113_c0_g1_i2.p2 TRINITY_DN13113_c0_g1~~TRINITY_DN13113_c0_g1_i2.p2  ORF type:complete len:135 (+),score=21.47 TRINITY_DN13113_c0_g1_i2:238-642(+)
MRVLGENDNLTLFTMRQYSMSAARLGKVQEATEAIEKFLEGQVKIFTESSNSAAWAYHYRGLFYQEIGYYEQALKDFQKAFQTLSKSALIDFSIGEIHFEREEYEQAFKKISASHDTRKKTFVEFQVDLSLIHI